jgi:hypothetical protein
VAVGRAGLGVARCVGVVLGLGVGLELGLGLWVDGDGLAAGSELGAGPKPAGSELWATCGIEATGELAKGLEGADGAPVAAETGAELPATVVPFPL